MEFYSPVRGRKPSEIEIHSVKFVRIIWNSIAPSGDGNLTGLFGYGWTGVYLEFYSPVRGRKP